MHPFEVGTVHWGYGQPRSADRGIRTNEVTHRFERNDHFDSTTKEQVELTSLDRDLRIGLAQDQGWSSPCMAGWAGMRSPSASKATEHFTRISADGHRSVDLP